MQTAAVSICVPVAARILNAAHAHAHLEIMVVSTQTLGLKFNALIEKHLGCHSTVLAFLFIFHSLSFDATVFSVIPCHRFQHF